MKGINGCELGQNELTDQAALAAGKIGMSRCRTTTGEFLQLRVNLIR